MVEVEYSQVELAKLKTWSVLVAGLPSDNTGLK